MGERGTVLLASFDALPASGGAADAAGSLQGFQGHAKAFVFHRKRLAELRSRERHSSGKQAQYLFAKIALPLAVGFGDDFQVGRFGRGRHELQIDRW